MSKSAMTVGVASSPQSHSKLFVLKIEQMHTCRLKDFYGGTINALDKNLNGFYYNVKRLFQICTIYHIKYSIYIIYGLATVTRGANC